MIVNYQNINSHIENTLDNIGLLLPTLDWVLSNSERHTSWSKRKLQILKESIEAGSINKSLIIEDDLYVEILSLNAIIAEYSAGNILYKSGSTYFPDIIVNDQKIGFEVKRMSGDSTLGNSSTQTLKNNIEEIYAISFTNDGERMHICKYEELINDIVVDHNPRFNLSVGSKNKFFTEELGQESLIDFFKKDEKERNAIVGKYLRKRYEGSDKWFMGIPSEITDEFIQSTIGKWSRLNKDQLRVDIFLNHPEVLITARYAELRRYLLEKYHAWGPVKDLLTAGGKKNGLPAIFYRFVEVLPKIKLELSSWSPQEKEDWFAHVEEYIKSTANGYNKLTHEQVEYVLGKLHEIKI